MPSAAVEHLALAVAAYTRTHGRAAVPVDAAVRGLLSEDERRVFRVPSAGYPYAMPLAEARGVILAFAQHRTARGPGEVVFANDAARSLSIALDGLAAVESAA